MESPLQSPSFFPSVPNDARRNHISIRSITYKKSLDNLKDLDFRKEMAKTYNGFQLNSPGSTMKSAFPTTTRASTQHGSKPTSPDYKSHLACTFHKLSLLSSKESARKLPALKSPKFLETKKSLYIYEDHEKQRKKRQEETKAMTAQEDYFQLLYDENRKTFKVEECEGVDEFYSNEMIQERIHKQGYIRDPDYFSTRVEFTQKSVPDEKTIKEDYRFKIPAVLASMENENTLATHVLGGTWNNVKFVESNIESAVPELAGIKAEKKQIEGQIENIKNKFEAEVENIEADFMKRFERFRTLIKEDFVANQNDNFKYQKEIVLLKRDKLKVEKEIDEAIPRLEELEDVLYGQNIFGLKANQEELEYIQNMNLRPEVFASMRNKELIH